MSPKITDLHRPALLGNHLVPGIWRHMLPPELRTLNFPRERIATCDKCPQIAAEGYRADYRCCTYYPRVPNFLMGLALSEERAGNIVRAESTKQFLLPDGFQPSPQLWATFLTEAEEGRFGKTDLILCPFLIKESRQCGIYAYRNSVCSTYFCEFEYGGQGRRFWDRLQTVTMQVELALSQWCLTTSGFDVKDYVGRLDALADDLGQASKGGFGWSLEARKFIWGDWFGRELDLYQACADAAAAHKEDLWDIAQGVTIIDATKYEKALNDLVPEKHREKLAEQAAEHESDAFAPAPPSKLWTQVVKQHRKMWKIAKAKSAKGFFDDGL